MEALQIGNQVIAADGVAGSDAQLAAVQRVRLKKLIFPFADQVHGRLNMPQENLSLRGELYFLCAPDKKRLIQLFFQNLDGLADSGLGNKQVFGRLGKTEGDSDVVKYFI